jgi:hypothetical protein
MIGRSENNIGKRMKNRRGWQYMWSERKARRKKDLQKIILLYNAKYFI